jgi:hypothetical protein
MYEYAKGAKHKTCVWCKKQYTAHPSLPNGSRQKYCSPECSQKASISRNTANRKIYNLGARLGLTGGKIGKINEVLVAIDLVKKGWNVYTAFEDTHPFDILAIKNGAQKRIEVKSATILPSGARVVCDPKKKLEDRSKYDTLASVDNLQNIIYEPAIE